MENQRLLLYLALGFLGLLIYQSWLEDYAVPPETTIAGAPASVDGAEAPADLPGALPEAVPGADLPGAPGGEAAPAAPAAAPPPPSEDGATGGELVRVRTDVMDIGIDPVGATIVDVALLDYAVSIDQPDVPFHLVSDDPNRFLVVQSGLQSSAGVPAPTHREPMRAEATEYALADGDDTLEVPFVWEEGGVRVTKTLTFLRDSYEVGLSYTVENGSGAPYTFNQYRQLKRKPATKDERQQFVHTYIGGVLSNPEDVYQKVDFGDMEDSNLEASATDGWVAMIQHYFATAWIPTPSEPNTAYTRHLPAENRYLIGLVSSPATVAPGETSEVFSTAYIGPKIQDRLGAAAPNLELTVDYGWLTIIAQPLFWLLKTIHSVIGNWGFAIIILTFMIKAVFYKLSEASYRSMARMKKLQPKLASLKERHGDDRAAMGQATMELYKKEKVNPLGGCLPMLVQIPVFIALYWTLLESVELRQAPWILWIEDLSIRDPFFVLPVIMAVTMYLQQKLNPAPVDPIQQKVFQFLPLVFGVFFAFFPAGLVLYWVVNNTLSIAQQYYITRHVLAEKPGGGGGGGLSLSKGPKGGGPDGGGGGGLKGRFGKLLGGTAAGAADASASTRVGAGAGRVDTVPAASASGDAPSAGDEAGAAAAAALVDAPNTVAALAEGSDGDATGGDGKGADGGPRPGGTPKPHRKGKSRKKRKAA